MRTRFLNTDYFTTSSSPIETLCFLNLPLSHLPPPPSRLSNFEENLLRLNPITNIPLEIDRFPIDSALSKFLSQVIPQIFDLDYGNFDDTKCRVEANDKIRISKKEAEALYEEKEEDEEEEEEENKDNKTDVDDTRAQSFEVIQFEAPVLDVILENSCFSGEGMQILSEVPEIENKVDLLGPGPKKQFSENFEKSVYLVEDVNLEYNMDQKAYELEDDGSVQEQTHFHNLEVDEISLGVFTIPSIEDELLSFLEKIESQQTPKNNLLIDGIEPLGSMQYDILECILNHCLSKQCLESEMASLDMFPGMDIISMVEALQAREDSANCFSPMNPIIFQDFKFLDLDSSHLYESFFEMQTTDEPETCDWMFREDMNFKNFNELIVSCELALVDDTFKSLPTPILSDHDKMKSIYAIVEEILAELQPQPLCASDEIYLDWHLLEEDKCDCKSFSSYQNALEELQSQSIDFDWEFFDDGQFVIDFICSDDLLSGPKMEEYKESLNMPSERTSSGQLIGVTSSKSLDDKFPKQGNGEQLTEENSVKASSLFISMSQFNDLDFFLNPVKATAGKKSQSAPDPNASLPTEGESHSIFASDVIMNNHKLDEQLNFVPIEDEYDVRSSEFADKAEGSCMPLPISHVPFANKSEQPQGAKVSFPETVIIVNTRDFDKEMIVSRRSTYQRILAMEKEGAQVVERDLNLPVDVMISSAICLVWYDCRNIGTKTTAADEAYSCLPLYIENVATNVLTLLSFTFSSCILVFEGEMSFLSIVMDSSDGLYAAAASLGIELQLFCSYSSELTDEIILSSILYATKLCRGVYPKMPESETLAESFLTKFPSINPLTAHAILSSGGMLIEFLEWSHECRILAVQHYHVPDESVALFSALCRYGVREDSKSVMTDCSSSVSSGPDSDKYHFNVETERKHKKCGYSPQKADVDMDGIWQSEPLDQITDGIQGSSGVFKQYDCWMSTDPEIFDGLKRPGFSLKDLFGRGHRSDVAGFIDSSCASKLCGSQNSKGPLVLDEITKPRLLLKDKLLGHSQGLEITIKNKMDGNNAIKSENPREDFIAELTNLIDSPSLDKDISSIPNSKHFSPRLPEEEQDSTRKSKAARQLSFDKISHPTFPTAAEIDSSSDLWTSVRDLGQSLQENSSYPDVEDHHNKVPIKYQKRPLEEVLMQQSAGNSRDLPFKEEMLHYGRTPLSKAIHSAQPQPGSPWTIEFLNRIREKSRLQQQSLPCNASIPAVSYSGNISKVTKRRSPSIIEFFKYQGGSTPGKIHEPKKQKGFRQLSSSSKNERISASLVPTWTPIDKRSRQTLSFAMNESGSQTRLVWADGNAHHQSKKFRTQ